MNLGTDSSKLLLATSENQGCALQSEPPGQSPQGTNRSSAQGQRGRGISPAAARFVPNASSTSKT